MTREVSEYREKFLSIKMSPVERLTWWVKNVFAAMATRPPIRRAEVRKVFHGEDGYDAATEVVWEWINFSDNG